MEILFIYYKINRCSTYVYQFKNIRTDSSCLQNECASHYCNLISMLSNQNSLDSRYPSKLIKIKIIFLKNSISFVVKMEINIYF